MPFVSRSQQRFLEAHPEKLKGKIGEWEQATNFSKLPEKKGKKFTHASKKSS